MKRFKKLAEGWRSCAKFADPDIARVQRNHATQLESVITIVEAEHDRLKAAAKELFAHSSKPRKDDWLTAEVFETYKATYAEMKDLLEDAQAP